MNAGSTAFTYDARGNPTGSGSNSYGYTAENLLKIKEKHGARDRGGQVCGGNASLHSTGVRDPAMRSTAGNCGEAMNSITPDRMPTQVCTTL